MSSSVFYAHYARSDARNALFLLQGLAWRDLVVIDQGDIEQCSYQLLRCKLPMLVHAMNRPWVSYKGRVLVTNDIYEALAGWFLILREECSGHVFRNDISDVVNTVLEFPLPEDDQPEYALQGPEHQPPDDEQAAQRDDAQASAPAIEQLGGRIGVLHIAL